MNEKHEEEYLDVEMLYAFGELRKLEDWPNDPRCVVSLKVLRERLRRGMPPEKAMTIDLHGSGFVGKVAPEPPRLIEAFGEKKTANEWKDDYRCAVSAQTILERIDKGIHPEDAISLKVRSGGRKAPTPKPQALWEAFGERKTLAEWREDPRMEVAYRTVRDRLRKGINLEQAMKGGMWREDLMTLTAWGETKTLVDWSNDERCVVTQTNLYRRIQNWECDAETAISAPVGTSPDSPRFRQVYTAWGETKRLGEWMDDPRCVNSVNLLTTRLKAGWPIEEAMTAPQHTSRSNKPRATMLEAFGERKSVKAWGADPRCSVSASLLGIRIKRGWDPERIVTQPPDTGSGIRGKRRNDKRTLRLTAFGETKAIIEWADDPRCVVSHDTLGGRVRNGWPPEEAITQPPVARGYATPRQRAAGIRLSIEVTAWGETKRLVEWEEDPRCKVGRDLANRRIKDGWPPERALSQPPGQKGRDRDGNLVVNNQPKFLVNAFGESKSVPQWCKDSRCQVTEFLLYGRLAKKWPAEEAISFPPGKKQSAYVSPSAKHAKRIEAWGEAKTISQWFTDPRCKVNAALDINARLSRGWKAEDAIGTPPTKQGQVGPGREKHKHYGKSYEAFGESRPLMMWADDPRCTVTYQTLHGRVTRGMPVEEAMTTPGDAHKLRITAWAESKTAGEWAEDSRCKVTAPLIVSRVGKGWPPEDAISTPASTSTVRPGKERPKAYGKYYEAFGESKPKMQWVEDPRCKVTYGALHSRIKAGWNLEDAITTPPSQADVRPGAQKPKNYGKSYDAFGESKPLALWAEDPRCTVSYYTLHRRVTNGWNLERALTASVDSQHLRITAWGETKTLPQWAKDSRCKVTGGTFQNRLKRGWTIEDALGTPPVEAGGVGPGKEKPRPYGPALEAFGEKKPAMLWGQDPRCKVDYHSLNRRVRKGWTVEAALTTPPDAKHVRLTAWGETKTLSQWIKDPRCKAKGPTVANRLKQGWPPEEALRTKPGETVPGRERAKIYGPAHEAFGESKPLALWAVGSSRVDLQACKLEYSIVSPK